MTEFPAFLILKCQQNLECWLIARDFLSIELAEM